MVAQAVRLMSSSRDETQALGTYALLSTSVHATPNEIANLTQRARSDDPTSVRLTVIPTTNERLCACSWRSSIAPSLSYAGVESQLHHALAT
jgi:hypothetical protein